MVCAGLTSTHWRRLESLKVVLTASRIVHKRPVIRFEHAIFFLHCEKVDVRYRDNVGDCVDEREPFGKIELVDVDARRACVGVELQYDRAGFQGAEEAEVPCHYAERRKYDCRREHLKEWPGDDVCPSYDVGAHDVDDDLRDECDDGDDTNNLHGAEHVAEEGFFVGRGRREEVGAIL